MKNYTITTKVSKNPINIQCEKLKISLNGIEFYSLGEVVMFIPHGEFTSVYNNVNLLKPKTK